MRRIALLCILITGILLSMGTVYAQDSRGQDDPKALMAQYPMRTTAQAILSAGNGIYEVVVDDTLFGLYTARTGANHPITITTGSRQNVLFGGTNGGFITSYNTLRSYSSGTDYVPVSGLSSSFTVLAIPDIIAIIGSAASQFVSVTPIGTVGYSTTIELPGPPFTPDAVTIVQDVYVVGTTFEDSRIVVSMSVTNTGNIPLSFGLRYLWDFQIGSDDGPTFSTVNPTGTALVNETQFVSPSFSFFRIEDNDRNATPPLFNVNGTVTGPSIFNPTPPDLVQFTSWGGAYNQAFDYTVNPSRTVAVDGMNNDTALTYFFGSSPINALVAQPGQTITVSESIFATEPQQNTAPTAVNDEVTITSGQSIVIDVLENDFDLDGNPIIVDIVQTTAAGAAVSITFPDYNIAYTPPPGFVGTDTFLYTISDGNGGTDVAQVTVNVEAPNQPPVAIFDLTETLLGEPIIIDVLANDSDPDNDILSVVGVSNVQNGSAVVNADNTVTFTPDGSLNAGVFTYTISDGTDTAFTTVTINPIIPPPTAVEDTAVTLVNTPVVIDVLANDSSVVGGMAITGVTAPLGGTAVIDSGAITYTPNPGFSGVDTFTYAVADIAGGTSNATVTVTVNQRICLPGDADYNPAVDLAGSALLPETDYLSGVVINTSTTCAYDVGIASYQMVDDTIDNQVFFDTNNDIVGPGQTIQLDVTAPTCARQIDLFYGETLLSLNGVRYGERLLDAIMLDRPNWCVVEPAGTTP